MKCNNCIGKGKRVISTRPYVIKPCKRCKGTGEIMPLKEKVNI